MFYKKTVLPSGLQIITERVPHVRSVALGFWVGFGSRDESLEMGGAAHFLEHLLFKGTERRDAREISEAFESLGAEFNAFSSKEYTTYHARFLDQHLPVAIDILSDMLQNSLLRSEDVESERSVIIEEIRMHEDSPDDNVHDIFLKDMWPDHPLGRPIAGLEKVISEMTRDDLHALYKKIYTPDRMVVAATGNVDHDELVAMIEERFVFGAAGSFERTPSFPQINSGLHVVDRKSEQAHIIVGGQGLKAHDAERFPLLVLDCILGGGMSSRLFQEIREKHALVYSVYSHYAMYTETGYFSVYAGTSPAKASEVIERINGELIKLAKEGATEEETYRCREHIKGSLVLSFESTANRMFRIGKAMISKGELLSLDEIIARIDAVTLDKVNELAASMLDVDRLVTTVLGPFPEGSLKIK